MPIWLRPDYGRSPESVLQQGWIYSTWVIPCGLIVFIWFLKERKSWFVAAGLFILGVLPVLGLIPFQFQSLSTVADSYLYLSMLCPSLALAWFLLHSRGRLATLVCVLILSLLGIRSSFQTWYWQDTIALFMHAMEVNANSSMAHNNFLHYSKVLQINPNYA